MHRSHIYLGNQQKLILPLPEIETVCYAQNAQVTTLKILKENYFDLFILRQTTYRQKENRLASLCILLPYEHSSPLRSLCSLNNDGLVS